MDKQKVISKIREVGVVAVVRAESAEQAIKITDACIKGGIPAIELTFTVPGANKVIEELAKKVKGILVAELNYGQVVHEVRRAAKGQCPVLLCGKYNMKSFEPVEIEAEIEKMVSDVEGGRA